MTALITAEMSADWFARKGLAAGEQADGEPRCVECHAPDDGDLVELAGMTTCIPCVVALTGDEHGPDRWRDLP